MKRFLRCRITWKSVSENIRDSSSDDSFYWKKKINKNLWSVKNLDDTCNTNQFCSPLKAVEREISSGKSSMALGGLYRTVDLMTRFDTTFPHTYDCASFISLTSTALPRYVNWFDILRNRITQSKNTLFLSLFFSRRYRAVLGPFRPSVWMTLVFAYLGAIIPITMSSKNSLLSLLTKPKQMNEMFWFVFSTFTNSFNIRSPLLYEGLGQNATGILIGNW